MRLCNPVGKLNITLLTPLKNVCQKMCLIQSSSPTEWRSLQFHHSMRMVCKWVFNTTKAWLLMKGMFHLPQDPLFPWKLATLKDLPSPQQYIFGPCCMYGTSGRNSLSLCQRNPTLHWSRQADLVALLLGLLLHYSRARVMFLPFPGQDSPSVSTWICAGLSRWEQPEATPGYSRNRHNLLCLIQVLHPAPHPHPFTRSPHMPPSDLYIG